MHGLKVPDLGLCPPSFALQYEPSAHNGCGHHDTSFCVVKVSPSYSVRGHAGGPVGAPWDSCPPPARDPPMIPGPWTLALPCGHLPSLAITSLQTGPSCPSLTLCFWLLFLSDLLSSLGFREPRKNSPEAPIQYYRALYSLSFLEICDTLQFLILYIV